jgi:hypothetical protein
MLFVREETEEDMDLRRMLLMAPMAFEALNPQLASGGLHGTQK